LAGSFNGVEDFDPSPDGFDFQYSNAWTGFLTRYANDGSYLGTSLIGAAHPAFMPDGSLAFATFVEDKVGLQIDVLNPDGSQRFVRTMDIYDWEAKGIAAGPDGSLTVAGNYGGRADFDPGCVATSYNNQSGSIEGFVVHLACVPVTADANGDGIVNRHDLPEVLECLSGPAPVVCNSGCYALDFDGDDDIDLADFAHFQNAVPGIKSLPPLEPSKPDRTR